jgi:hypothetical protein
MKHFVIVIVIALFFCSGCASKNWTINGIPAERFKKMQAKDAIYLGTGMLSSFAAHWLGHVAYIEGINKDWHMEGWTTEYCDEYLTDGEAAWFGRSGFVGQLLVGATLKYGPWSKDFKQSYFVTGYHLGTTIEIVKYPFMSPHGDLDLIDRHSNSTLEWAGYTATSLLLLK